MLGFIIRMKLQAMYRQHKLHRIRAIVMSNKQATQSRNDPFGANRIIYAGNTTVRFGSEAAARTAMIS
jgi:hypothetical protein